MKYFEKNADSSVVRYNITGKDVKGVATTPGQAVVKATKNVKKGKAGLILGATALAGGLVGYGIGKN